MQHRAFDLLLSVASNVMHSQGLHSFTIIHMPERNSRGESPRIKIKNERKKKIEQKKTRKKKKRLSVGNEIEYQQAD